MFFFFLNLCLRYTEWKSLKTDDSNAESSPGFASSRISKFVMSPRFLISHISSFFQVIGHFYYTNVPKSLITRSLKSLDVSNKFIHVSQVIGTSYYQNVPEVPLTRGLKSLAFSYILMSLKFLGFF